MTCIVIPVYNRKDLTLGCLDLLRWTRERADWRVIVVDDCSTDGTAEAIREQHPQVDLVQGSGDLFWTGAMRRGMERALDLHAEVIIWLNDDTCPDEASLLRISEVVKQQPDMVLASQAVVNGAVHCCHSLRRGPAPSSGGDFDVADVLAGYQVAFSRELVEKIGLPDDRRWPHYAGDSSYTHTAHKKGFKLRIDNRSQIRLSGYEPYRPVGRVFWAGKKSLSQRIHSCFIAKKSKYRLATQWHLDVLYRGRLGACVVFPARLAVWLFQIARESVKPI
ncbi:glycosyltransferase family 2 protein [Prosthecobacter sp.]|uniref:glycosyltransferase family 2 protein n=1 Tax=Prosthecobacter sp. TaxID=1965333 RepID=UPI0037843808